MFLIVMSTGTFAFDLNEIGFPLREYIPVNRFVTRPRSGKSSLVLCLNESCSLFWCQFCLVLVFLISLRTWSNGGLGSVGLFMSSLVSLFRVSSTNLLREEISLK